MTELSYHDLRENYFLKDKLSELRRSGNSSKLSKLIFLRKTGNLRKALARLYYVQMGHSCCNLIDKVNACLRPFPRHCKVH